MTQHLAVPVCSHEYAIYLFYAKRPGKVLVFFFLPIFPFNTMISMPSLLISSLTFCLIFVLITFRMNYAKEKQYFLLKVFPTVWFNMGWRRWCRRWWFSCELWLCEICCSTSQCVRKTNFWIVFSSRLSLVSSCSHFFARPFVASHMFFVALSHYQRFIRFSDKANNGWQNDMSLILMRTKRKNIATATTTRQCKQFGPQFKSFYTATDAHCSADNTNSVVLFSYFAISLL